jgi:phosphoribosylformimino-5-aminoimidazole carboxamide ribotide isomerase
VIVYPAIDIRGGKCVRLVEGDFAQETVFGEDPAEMARTWEAQGAAWIHVVDLDGAKSGTPRNADAIDCIRAAVGCSLQVGGGIRSEQDVERYLYQGIERVVLGTKAIQDPELIINLSSRWGSRIAVGLDARNGKLAGSGWLDQTEVDALAAARQFQTGGISTLIYTDIARDGTLAGPNVPSLKSMVSAFEGEVIASGGVGNIGDISDIKASGARGVIVGRALYDRRVSLPEALKIAS